MVESRRTKNYRGKCIICGDSTVGKSALTQGFCSDGVQFPKTYLMTTGVDMVVKNVNIPDTPDIVEMFLYDLAGKDIFQDVVHSHMANAQMVMLVYDVSNVESFRNIEEWYEKVRSIIGESRVPTVLVANKIDLATVGRQVVTEDDGKLLAERLDVEFFQCTAKEAHNVDVPFLNLAASFYEKEANQGIIGVK